MNDFHKIANEILQIPDENLSWEERLNELVKFRAYLKEYYDSYNDDYLSFLEKIGSENDLEEKYILEYDFKKEVLSKDYDLDGLNYLLVNILFKYKLAIEDYNEYVNLLKEKHDVELKADWEKILSEKDLDLLEGLRLSVQHCEEVMKENADRYPVLENSYNILMENNANLKEDIKECTEKIEALKNNQENGDAE